MSTGAAVRLLPALGWVEQQQSAATGTDAAPEQCLVLSEADARRAVHRTGLVAALRGCALPCRDCDARVYSVSAQAACGSDGGVRGCAAGGVCDGIVNNHAHKLSNRVVARQSSLASIV